MQWGGNRRTPARLGGHQETSGFLLDRIRRRARPRNRQTRKSFCQSRTNDLPTLRAIGYGRIDTEVRDVTAGARSTATHGTIRPRSPEQSRHPPARTARSGATFNPSQRSATTTAAASSTAAIAFGWDSSRPGPRLDDYRKTGCPEASCAIRFGNKASIAHCRSAVAPLHSPISAMVRPQPVQSPACASSAQTATHGDSGGSITPFP